MPWNVSEMRDPKALLDAKQGHFDLGKEAGASGHPYTT